MNTTSRSVSLMIVLSLFVFSGLESPSWAVDPADLRNKQDAQQRARVMTKELITNVLDIQIQQLEENGLQQLPVFKDIKSMRTNIDALVEAQMNQVLALLTKAQQGTAAERDQAFKQARGMIREIVLKLVTERQTLLRRLKAAEIVAQIKRLIELESAALQTTHAIPAEKQTRQEQLALAVIEDQQDVKGLFLQLMETLIEIRGWGGPVGAGASDALRILKAGEVGRELDQAGQNLEAAKYAAAAKNQEATVKTLRMILEQVEGAQGVINSDRQAVTEMLQTITKLQEDVRDLTQQAEQQNQTTVEKPLIDQQAQVQQDLGKLAQALEPLAAERPQLTTLLEQAKVAAQEARSELFEGKLPDAQQDQGKVLGSLAEITQQLQQADGAKTHDQSAAQLAQLVTELKQARTAIQQAEEHQTTATQTAAQEPANGQAAEEQVAAKVAEAAQAKVPAGVQSRLAEAEAAAKDAATELASVELTPHKNQQAVENSAEALERATAEIEAALADAQREHLAVKIGELARAAETLERAASAERNLAEETRAAARKQALPAAAAKELQSQQSEITQVTEKIADAIHDLASAAAQTLEQARQSAATVTGQLERAPDATGAAAQSVAQDAARAADDTATQLTKASAQIRDEIQRASKELTQITKEQLAAVRQARGAVEATQSKLPESHATQLGKLEAAEESISQAQQHQQRAAGRPEAADALALIEQIGVARKQQAAADAAHEAFAAGQSNTPLAAAAQQQAVAEDTKKLAEQAAARPQAKAQSPDALSAALNKARSAAQEAAKETLNGDQTKAEAARHAAKTSLQTAQQLAVAEAVTAQQAPAGTPDLAAQKQVGAEIRSAQELAAGAAPEVDGPLAEAGEQSSRSEQQLNQGQADDVGSTQQMTSATLARARQELQAARADLNRQQAEKFATEGQQADELAGKTAKVDAGATGAVQSAELSAEKGSADAAQTNALETSKTQQAVQRALEQAAAALAAREQQIRRDQAIAQTLGDLAEQQQAAAEAIAKQREALNAAAEATRPVGDGQRTAQASDGLATSPQRQAAQALSEATQDFAEAQRATGQGAEEISGQSEVANPPLREALEMASNLNTNNLNTGEKQTAAPRPSSSNPKVKPPASQQAAKGKPEPTSPKNEPPDAASPSSEPQEPTSDSLSEETAEGDAAAGAEGPTANDQKLGTGMVPSAPDATAEQIAGKKAMQEMQLALANKPSPNSQPASQPLPKGKTPGQPNAAGDKGEGESPSASKGQSQLQAKSSDKPKDLTGTEGGKTSQKGRTDHNQGLKEGPLDDTPQDAMAADEQTDKSRADADAKARKLREEPWFAKLPPDLRKAIRAKSQRPAPKGYEERLKRYFQSID